jgi:hypothetical protein
MGVVRLGIRDLFLAVAGWCCLAAFTVEWLTGSGKSMFDYAQHSLQPLESNGKLAYDDRLHAIWSGWWTPSQGYRLTNGADPDVVFVSGATRDCSIVLAAFPLLGGSRPSQVVYAALNGGDFSGPVSVAAGGEFRLAHVGNLVAGVNRLTLRLPYAGKINATDERVLALGVQSIAFVCEGK